MNIVTLDGRIASDPEYKTVGAKDTPLLTFNFANETGYGEYKKTGFFKCEMWGNTAEKMANHLFKGKPLTISGELQQDSWETPEGYKRQKAKIRVEKFSFHMSDPKGSEGSGAQSSGPKTATPPPQGANPFGNQPGDKPMDDDGIPF